MNRTEAQAKAAERDGKWCLWCLYVKKKLSPMTEVHHIFGRARSDEPETCVGLCHECHQRHHMGVGATTIDFVQLMIYVYHFNYDPYTQFVKPIGNSRHSLLQSQSL
jgi:hypothetical protein